MSFRLCCLNLLVTCPFQSTATQLLHLLLMVCSRVFFFGAARMFERLPHTNVRAKQGKPPSHFCLYPSALLALIARTAAKCQLLLVHLALNG